MAHLVVQPRNTPAERAEASVEIEVDAAAVDYATQIEEWVAPRQAWVLTLREGHEFGRTNNVEAELLFAAGEQTSSLTFRLEQLSSIDDTGQELVLVLEERDGVARLARLTPNGLDVELFHVLTFT